MSNYNFSKLIFSYGARYSIFFCSVQCTVNTNNFPRQLACSRSVQFSFVVLITSQFLSFTWVCIGREWKISTNKCNLIIRRFQEKTKNETKTLVLLPLYMALHTHTHTAHGKWKKEKLKFCLIGVFYLVSFGLEIMKQCCCFRVPSAETDGLVPTFVYQTMFVVSFAF